MFFGTMHIHLFLVAAFASRPLLFLKEFCDRNAQSHVLSRGCSEVVYLCATKAFFFDFILCFVTTEARWLTYTTSYKASARLDYCTRARTSP